MIILVFITVGCCSYPDNYNSAKINELYFAINHILIKHKIKVEPFELLYIPNYLAQIENNNVKKQIIKDNRYNNFEYVYEFDNKGWTVPQKVDKN